MVTDEGTIRVTDVGLNTLTIQHMHHDYVPVPVAWVYKSPEELSDGTHSIQTDVYSFGSTVYAVSDLVVPIDPKAQRCPLMIDVCVMPSISSDHHSERDNRDHYRGESPDVRTVAAHKYEHRYMGDDSKLLGTRTTTKADNGKGL